MMGSYTFHSDHVYVFTQLLKWFCQMQMTDKTSFWDKFSYSAYFLRNTHVYKWAIFYSIAWSAFKNKGFMVDITFILTPYHLVSFSRMASHFLYNSWKPKIHFTQNNGDFFSLMEMMKLVTFKTNSQHNLFFFGGGEGVFKPHIYISKVQTSIFHCIISQTMTHYTVTNNMLNTFK